MDYLISITLIFTIFCMVSSMPLNVDSPPDNPDDTIAVYVPYDIKYLPVEVPEKYLQDTLTLNAKESLSPIVVTKEDLVDQLKRQEPVKLAISELPLSDKKPSLANADEAKVAPTKIESLVVVPNSAISQALRIQAVPKSEELEILSEKPDFPTAFNSEDFVVLPVNTKTSTSDEKSEESSEPAQAPDSSAVNHSAVENKESSTSTSRSRSKRQAPGFSFYRPVLRFSRTRTNRRRVQRPNRQNALVGYLNDRDFFPTVA